jgi:hypothetical protein
MTAKDKVSEASATLDGLACAKALDAAIDEARIFDVCGTRYAMAVAITRFLAIAGSDPKAVAEDYVAKFESAYAEIPTHAA